MPIAVTILRSCLVLSLLTGCASLQSTASPDAAPTAAAATITPAQPAAVQHSRSLNQLTIYDDLNAGDSQASRKQAPVRPDGSLQPWALAWAQALKVQRQIPVALTTSLLQNARYNATAAKLMAPSKGRIKKSWVTYKNRFVEPIRIREGLAFWHNYADTLAQAEQQYGVPASILVAIIGVETLYGKYTGDFNVLEVLSTLGFSYPDDSRPERGELFRNQLADLIYLHSVGQLDATSVEGSFAGAMGLPQFMPGSLLRYAQDGDHDGQINLHDSVADVSASIANFLLEHGWVVGQPPFLNVPLPAQPEKLVTGGLEATLDWHTLYPNQTPPAGVTTALGIVNLVDEPRNTVEYRVATPSFFSITHYNRSYFYATSVVELAKELEAAFKRGN